MSDSSIRNALYSRLLMKKASFKSSKFCRQVLVARFGLPGGNQEEAPVSAELWVFKGSHNPANTSSLPPKFIIPLQGARLEQILLPVNSGGSDGGGSSGGGGDDEEIANNCSRGDGDGEAAASSCSGDGKASSNCSGSTPVEQIILPENSVGGDSSSEGSGSGDGVSGFSSGSSKEVGSEVRKLPSAPGNSLFGLTTADRKSYHFRVFNEEECKTWTNLLKFLIVFPHSTLPVVPCYDPTELHEYFDPILYNADSVWPIYIPPDELGLRCGIQGPGVLTLQNQKPGLSMSKLEIYSMANHQVPVLSCKHNEIRRTGKMGLFLYVEIGSRSKYGAGLLWMYFGSSNKKASSMRDLMCNFLLQQKSDLMPRLRRAYTAPILISTLTSPQLQKHNSVREHRSSLPPPLLPRKLPQHVHPHLTTITSKEDSASIPTDSIPGSEDSLFRDQNQKCFFVPETPQEKTGEDQKYSCHHILEPPGASCSESECMPNSDPKQNYYHVLETLQENVSDQSSPIYHVLEPEKEPHFNPKPHHYHTLEPNVATANSMDFRHYDTVDLKRTRRHSEQKHLQQCHPLETNTATQRRQSLDTAYHTIKTTDI